MSQSAYESMTCFNAKSRSWRRFLRKLEVNIELSKDAPARRTDHLENRRVIYRAVFQTFAEQEAMPPSVFNAWSSVIPLEMSRLGPSRCFS